MPGRDAGFRTQADAIRAARIALWGDLPLARRACILSQGFEAPNLVVSALVNGRLVVIRFDNFGRLSQVQVDGSPRVLVLR